MSEKDASDDSSGQDSPSSEEGEETDSIFSDSEDEDVKVAPKKVSKPAVAKQPAPGAAATLLGEVKKAVHSYTIKRY